MSICSVFSCVVRRGCWLWPVDSLGKTLLAFALLHSGLLILMGFSRIRLQCRRPQFYSWIGKICWRREKATGSSTLAWRIQWTIQTRWSQSRTRLSNFHFSGPFNLASGGYLAVPSFDQQLFKPALGAQRRSWRLKSCLQEMGDKKTSMSGSPRGPCTASIQLSSGFTVFVFLLL